MGPLNRRLALAVFAILVLAAPLLFGAVDRVVQIGLVLLLGIGFLLVPPAVPHLRRWVKWSIALGIGLVLAKEFLPAALFGETMWRGVLARDFGIAFLPTHNPEPGRALDAILAAAIAGAWFVWTRTLAEDRKSRLLLAWILLGSVTVFAVVCLALGTRADSMILGWRYTPGWTGFGLFPNRNHTAALLAMGALLGCGCLAQAARRKRWTLLASSLLAVSVIFVAMLESKSRGGLMGFGCGIAVFGALTLCKMRSRAALASTLAAAFLCAGMFLAFGAKVSARFNSPEEGNIPTNLRWGIWNDTVGMWKDAPVFGHGLETFAQLFPLYQHVRPEEHAVIHPESSWLLWLVELGALPTLLGAAALAFFLSKNVRGLLESERGFFIRAGCFAAVAALLCHSIWDVPAHRWGTAGFGLAMLAIACPLRQRDSALRLDRMTALVPLGIAGFWLLPFFYDAPEASPETLKRLLARSASTPTRVPVETLQSELRWFPLDYHLHQALGLRLLVTAKNLDEAWREFRAADRLATFLWQLPFAQAWASRQYSSGMTVYFWSLAIERGGRRTDDIFQIALRNTQDLDVAESFWASYSVDHPEFLLSYADFLPDRDAGRAVYDRWWKTRGSTASTQDLKPFEIQRFYGAALKWGAPEQLELWMKRHSEMEERDYKAWARLLHAWGRDEAAWQLLAHWIKEPQFSVAQNTSQLTHPEMLEAKWRANPADALSAQAFAEACLRRGELERERQVIFTIADGEKPPLWFVRKAAYLRAQNGDFSSAAAMLLHESGG